jgi:hypothetical protein
MWQPRFKVLSVEACAKAKLRQKDELVAVRTETVGI